MVGLKGLILLSAMWGLTFGDQCPRCDRLNGSSGTLEYSWTKDNHCWWFSESYDNFNQYALAVKINSMDMSGSAHCNGYMILPEAGHGTCHYNPGNCIMYTNCDNLADVKTRLKSEGCNKIYNIKHYDFQCQKLTVTTRDLLRAPKSFSLTYTYFKCTGVPEFTSSTTSTTATPRTTTSSTTTTTNPTTTTTTTPCTTPTTTTTTTPTTTTTTTPTTTTTTTTPTTTTTTTPTTTTPTATFSTTTAPTTTTTATTSTTSSPTTTPTTTTSPAAARTTSTTAARTTTSATTATTSSSTTTTPPLLPKSKQPDLVVNPKAGANSGIEGRTSNQTTPGCENEPASTVPTYFVIIIIVEAVLLGISIFVIIWLQARVSKLTRRSL